MDKARLKHGRLHGLCVCVCGFKTDARDHKLAEDEVGQPNGRTNGPCDCDKRKL